IRDWSSAVCSSDLAWAVGVVDSVLEQGVESLDSGDDQIRVLAPPQWQTSCALDPLRRVSVLDLCEEHLPWQGSACGNEGGVPVDMPNQQLRSLGLDLPVGPEEAAGVSGYEPGVGAFGDSVPA